jgi:hypothetical protein
MKSKESFILIETDNFTDRPKRMWVFDSDVDAQRANKILATRVFNVTYRIKRADLIEI